MGLTDEEISTVIKYRIDKSAEVLSEATDVAALGHWNLAVNRLYYAVFHICNALLLSQGNSARTHSGTIHLMLLKYVKPGILSHDDGTLISTLFNMRNTGDYDDLFDWTENQVRPLIDPTKTLIDKIRCLIV